MSLIGSLSRSVPTLHHSLINQDIHRPKMFPTIARCAVSRSVSPRIIQTISLGDRIQAAIFFHYTDHIPDSVLPGRNHTSNPLTGYHRHCHIFHEANQKNQNGITHITSHAPMGFDESACRTRGSIRKIWRHGGHDVHLTLLGIGNASDLPDCDLFCRSICWESSKPFTATRHPETYKDGRPKKYSRNRWIGFSEHDLVRLLQAKDFSERVERFRLKFLHACGRKLISMGFMTIRKLFSGTCISSHTACYRILPVRTV